MGLADLRSRPDYKTREDRKRNRLALRTELEAVLRTRPALEWEAELNARGVPAGAVLTVPDVLETPQIRDRGFLHPFSNVPGVGRDIEVVTTGIQVDGAACTVDRPPPELGQDADTIWGALGVSAQDQKRLRAEGAI